MELEGLRFKPLLEENHYTIGVNDDKAQLHKEKQTNMVLESKACHLVSEHAFELEGALNVTKECMPELIRMVPKSPSREDEFVCNLTFIKTEDGQMQCLNCHSIFDDIDSHKTQCSIRSQDGRDVNSNAADTEPEKNIVPSPVHEALNQPSSCSGINEELPDLDSLYPEIKIEPMETNNSVADNTHSCTNKEELIQCSNCQLYFNDRCAYLDHKMFTCKNEILAQSTDTGLSTNFETSDSSVTQIKIEPSYDSQFNIDRTDQIDEVQNYDSTPDGVSFKLAMPVCDSQPTFTCSCQNCGAYFDDFFTYSAHKKDCKRPQIGSVIEELNLRKTTCAVCKDKFKSKLELSKHTISVHVGSGGQRCTKKRKFPETDGNCDTEQSEATIARGTSRNFKRFKCNFDECSEKFLTLADFKSHYAVHLQSVRTKVEQKGYKLVLDQMETEKNALKEDFLNMKSMTEQYPYSGIDVKPTLPLVESGENNIDKMYKCVVEGCANSFGYSGDLERHLHSVHGRTKIHNDKSVFQCQNKGCGLLFETKELLKEHIQDIHMVGSSKPKVDFPDLIQYVCTLCFSMFQSIDHVFKHLHTAHGVKDTIFSNLYVVKKMCLCRVCHLYIEVDGFRDHVQRCNKQNTIKVSLDNTSQDTSQLGQVSDKENKKSDTKCNNEASEKTTHILVDTCIEKPDHFIFGYLRNYVMQQPNALVDVGRTYRCNVCNLTMPKKNETLIHLIQMHGVLAHHASNMSYEGSNYSCKLCQLRCSYEHGILAHLVKTHAIFENLSVLEACSKVTGKPIDEIKESVSALTKGKHVLFAKTATLTKDKHVVPATAGPMTKDKDVLLANSSAVTKDNHVVSVPSGTLTKDKHVVSARTGTLTKGKHIVSAPTVTLAKDKDVFLANSGTLTKEKYVLPATSGLLISRKCAICDFECAEKEDYKSHLLKHYNEVKSGILNVQNSSTGTVFHCQVDGCKAHFGNFADFVVHESKYHTIVTLCDSSERSKNDIKLDPRLKESANDKVVKGNNSNSENLENSDAKNSSKDDLVKDENDSMKEILRNNKTETSDPDKETQLLTAGTTDSLGKSDCYVKRKETQTSFSKTTDSLGKSDYHVKVKETHASTSGTTDTLGKFDCHVCRKTFPYQHVLSYHLLSVHQIVSHKCNWHRCTAIFTSAAGLKSHVQSHLKEALNSEDNIKTGQFCPFKYDNEAVYIQHLNKEHKNSKTTKRCRKLDKVLNLDYNLLPYKCTFKECDKAFLYRRDLNIHKQAEHYIDQSNTKPEKEPQHVVYKCPAEGCFDTFLNKRILDSHFIKKHSYFIKKPKQPYQEIEGDDISNELLYTTSDIKIELVDDTTV